MEDRLYYQHPRVFEKDLKVQAVRPTKEGWECTLSEALFYPEGGGQPADLGWIGSSAVTWVSEADDEIWHQLQEPVTEGQIYPCKVDIPRRRILTQQHSGEHLLAAAFFNLYGINTVGLRMGLDLMTLDLDKKVDAEAIQAAEDLANQTVTANLPVEALWPEFEVLATLPLRKAPPKDQRIRVLRIPGYDHSACCGTHVAFTGEIGLVKVLKSETYKGGTRLTFACGQAALRVFQASTTVLNDLCQRFSASLETLPEAVSRYQEEQGRLRDTCKKLKSEQLIQVAEQLAPQGEKMGLWNVISYQDSQGDIKALKELAEVLTKKPHSIALLYSRNNESLQVVFQRSGEKEGPSMKVLLERVKEPLSLKGGGNEGAAQGSGSVPDSDQWLKNVKDEILAQL